jgi:bleomycin hydrolase
MRLSIMKKYNIEEFELSQSYLFWYDKFEKSNYFLEAILDTLDHPVNSRLIQHLLQDPVSDGGQWDMLVNLVNKVGHFLYSPCILMLSKTQYGVVPKAVFPETVNTESSGKLNVLLTSKLREFAMILRKLATKESMTKE